MSLSATFNELFKMIEYVYWKNTLHFDPSTRISVRTKICGGKGIFIGPHSIISEYAILDCTNSPFIPSHTKKSIDVLRIN